MTEGPNLTIPSWAVPGARVVAIAEQTEIVQYLQRVPPVCPVINDVYTIDDVVANSGGGAFTVYEIPDWQRINDGMLKIHWAARYFRPLVAQKTEQEDVAIFERIAHGTTIVERLDLLKEKLDAS